MKKSLLIGIILLVICFSFTIYNEIKKNNLVNIHEITNSGSKKENVEAYLDTTFVAGTITGDNNKSFYVVFGDGVQYIIYIDNKSANKINNYLLDNPDASYRLYGTTKLIPSSIEENGKKFVKEWLDNNHDHEHTKVDEGHTHDITTEEFYHYFGHVYLDTTRVNPTVKIIIYLTGIIGALLVFNFVIKKFHLQ